MLNVSLLDTLDAAGRFGGFWRRRQMRCLVGPIRPAGCIIAAVAMYVSPLSSRAEDANAKVPTLIQELTVGDRQVRRDAAMKLGQLGPAAKDAVSALVKAIDDPDRQISTNALEALGDIGPAAKDAIPALIDALDSRKVRGARGQGRQQSALRAAESLSMIGADAVQPLIKALGSDDSMQRQWAAKALGGIGSSAQEAVPALVGNLGHGDLDVHQSTIEALIEIGSSAIKPLTEALGSSDARVREGAARALAGIGKASRDAGGKLAELAEKDPDTTARAAALGALSRVGVEPERSIPLLLQGVRSGDDTMRHAAVNGIALIRPSETVATALQTLLSDQDPAVRQRAAHALSRLGSKAVPAAAALIACAKAAPDEPAFTEALAQSGQAILPLLLQELGTPAGGQPPRQDWVFRALRDMGASAMPALAKGLESPDAKVRAAAARALGDLPIQSKPVIKTLAGLTSDPDATVRASALRSIATVRTERDAMIPKLEAALQDSDPQVRKAASAGLAAMGAVEKVSVPGLIDLLHDSDAATQVSAARALGDLGANANQAVGALIEGLNQPTLQSSAVEALGKIGPAAEPAGPRLLEIAHGNDRELAITALQALGGIGKPIPGLLPFLYDSLKNDDREVRLSALQSIVKAEPDRDKLLSLLIKSLQDESGRIRRVAALGVKPYGEKAQAAVPGLMAMLDRDIDRALAIDALRAIHVRDVQHLLAALNNKDAKVRVFACELLSDMGSDAKDAIPALEQKAEGDAEPVRTAAKKALARINGKS